MAPRKLNVYVWEDVLKDYTSGIIVVSARTEDEARKRVKAKSPTAFREIDGVEPRIMTEGEPGVIVLYGGS